MNQNCFTSRSARQSDENNMTSVDTELLALLPKIEPTFDLVRPSRSNESSADQCAMEPWHDFLTCPSSKGLEQFMGVMGDADATMIPP